jgi:hypothetical protein
MVLLAIKSVEAKNVRIGRYVDRKAVVFNPVFTSLYQSKDLRIGTRVNRNLEMGVIWIGLPILTQQTLRMSIGQVVLDLPQQASL